MACNPTVIPATFIVIPAPFIVIPGPFIVIPAKAGISSRPAVTSCPGTPAVAGATGGGVLYVH
jgi:hypothetical protein